MAGPKNSQRLDPCIGRRSAIQVQPALKKGVLEARLSDFFAARMAHASLPQALCVALSGGRDSVVLLHALNRLSLSSAFPFSLSALHVHHGISAKADAWAEFCADLCRSYDVPCSVVRVSVPRDSGEGLEGAARRLRHACFAGCAADWLALAHHRDDQAETVLLKLLRGAGIAGAAGMLADRPQASGPTLVRPLLDLPRALIEAYADEHHLAWVDDESNEDSRFRRNFLRNEIMPVLEGPFPGASSALARAAAHFAEGAELLDVLAKLDHAATVNASGRLALATFNALPPPRARNLLRYTWLTAGFQAPDTRWIDEALKQLSSAAADSETCVTTAEAALHIYRGELYIVRQEPLAPILPCVWAGQNELAWAGGRLRFVQTTGSGICCRRLAQSVAEIRPRQGGERFQPDCKRPRRSLRNLLQERGFPPWERERLPFLWLNGRLAWVGGLGIDTEFSCAPGEAGILPVWDADLLS